MLAACGSLRSVAIAGRNRSAGFDQFATLPPSIWHANAFGKFHLME
jgi:hypothetical protein